MHRKPISKCPMAPYHHTGSATTETLGFGQGQVKAETAGRPDRGWHMCCAVKEPLGCWTIALDERARGIHLRAAASWPRGMHGVVPVHGSFAPRA